MTQLFEIRVPDVGNVAEIDVVEVLIKAGDVAAGRIDAYLELHINLWDVAAAISILTEAGAEVSPFMEGDGLNSGNPIFAAAPGIAAALREATGFPAS